MGRIYDSTLGGGDPIKIDLGKVAAIEKVQCPGIADVELLVHFDGGGHLRLLEHRHPALMPDWASHVRSLEREEATHGR